MDDVQTVAWVVQFVDPHMGDRATPRRVVALHNAVGDYRDLDPDATSTELVLRADYDALAKRVRELELEVGAKQAKIDALMLEWCPDEMTPEQIAEWGRNQAPCSDEETARIRAAMQQDG